MNDYKKITLISFSIALSSIIGIKFFDPYQWIVTVSIFSSAIFIFIQKSNSLKEIIPKLLLGNTALLFFGWTCFFIRHIAKSLYLKKDILFHEFFDSDVFEVLITLFVISLISGLLFIIPKGLHLLYPKLFKKSFIFITPLILAASSFLLWTPQTSGTITSKQHGWPTTFITHNVKDIAENTKINNWVFTKYHALNFIQNYLFFFLVLLVIQLIINYSKKKLKTTKHLPSNLSILISLSLIFTFCLTSFNDFKRTSISKQIRKASYCTQDNDCTQLRMPNYYYHTAVNKNEINKIRKIVSKYPNINYYSKYQSRRYLWPICEKGKCSSATYSHTNPYNKNQLAQELDKYAKKKRLCQSWNINTIPEILVGGTLINFEEDDNTLHWQFSGKTKQFKLTLPKLNIPQDEYTIGEFYRFDMRNYCYYQKIFLSSHSHPKELDQITYPESAEINDNTIIKKVKSTPEYFFNYTNYLKFHDIKKYNPENPINFTAKNQYTISTRSIQNAIITFKGKATITGKYTYNTEPFKNKLCFIETDSNIQRIMPKLKTKSNLDKNISFCFNTTDHLLKQFKITNKDQESNGSATIKIDEYQKVIYPARTHSTANLLEVIELN